MRSVLPARLLRARAAVAAVAATVILTGLSTVSTTASAQAAGPGPQRTADGFGLTQVGEPVGSATNFVITVTTPEVAGEHHIRILLPRDYAADATKRYPVLYFLHGASDDPGNPNLAYPALTATQKMITVIPDGGKRGWYTNWLDQHTAAGAQNWENFHIQQVIPFIDANFRTNATRSGRAVAGLSMGGFGSVHYAQNHPELFSQVGAFSGAVDLSVDHLVMRAAVVATLTNVGAALCGTSGPTCSLDFGPAVSSDAIFGSPYPVFNVDWRWTEADPSTHMDRLAGMGVALYTGNGDGDAANPELWAQSASAHAKEALDALGQPYHYVDYGNGAMWGGSCDGGHNSGCWAQDLVDFVPRLEATLVSA